MSLKYTIESLCERYRTTREETIRKWVEYNELASRWHTPSVEEFNDMYVSWQEYLDAMLESRIDDVTMSFPTFVNYAFVSRDLFLSQRRAED